MGTEETAVLLGFLTGGLLVGVVGAWVDSLVSFIRKG